MVEITNTTPTPTIRMFTAIDEAFAKINSEFDSEGNVPSFQAMYDAISMLQHKVHMLEMSAFFQYKLDEMKPNVDTKVGVR